MYTPNMTDIAAMNEAVTWKDLTEGCHIYGPGTSKLFNTGEWRVDCPVFIADKCKQCLLCVPYCPDGSIPVKDGKRGEFADETAFEGLMNAFYADCKRLEVTRLNEGADVPWVEVE